MTTDTRLIRADGSAAWPDGKLAARYAFVHELYRDVLYERLAPGRRAAMHDSVGRSLEQAYAGAAEPYFAARLAHHFTQADDPDRSVRYLQAAAAQSLARSAHAEAARHATAALEMLGAMRARGDVAGDEITLRTIVAVAQTALRGWAAPEIEASYERARQLCETTDRSRLPPVLYGLATLHEYRGAYDRSEALMAEHLETGGKELVPEALELLACSTFHQGRFARSVSFAERALATYDVSLTSEYLARYGESPAVNYHCWAALSLWFLGRERESLEHLRAALGVAEQHVYSRTTAQSQSAFLQQFRGDAAETRRWADTTLDVAREHGFPFRTAQATILRGWAIAAAGESDRGADELRRGLALYRATGAGMDLPYYLGLQAEVELRGGRQSDALTLVAEAQATVPARGFFYEPQLLVLEARLRSETDLVGATELLTRAAAVADAQAALRTSAEISTLLDRLRAHEAIGRDDLLGRPAGGHSPHRS
jgi:predicted ATPase